MSERACPRRFEAEAVRDGRLGGAERASFERHASMCGDCAGEVVALESLSLGLRSLPAEATDELHARRAKTRLLAAFDGALVHVDARTRRAPWRLAALAVAIGITLLVAVTRRAHPRSVATSTEILADPSAVWSTVTVADRERIHLETGTLRIRVDEALHGHGVVVELPDGDLEDMGTTFEVRAEGGRTVRVVVEAGAVVLRLRGRAPIALAAGAVWTPEERRVATAEPAAPTALAPTAEPSAAPPVRVVTPVAPKPVDPAVAFRSATDALSRGDSREAATKLDAFVRENPRDSHAEDAAYLRVIALGRCGDDAGARDAAREYLRRFPSGFRHVEVEAVAR